MAMYKSFFDLSPEQTASTEMPHTVKFCNETGTGSMIICPLFLGAELYYNDMHLAFFEEATAPMRNVIEINHCRVGRYECSFGANSCCYLAAGDFAVCAAARKKSSSCFPLRHYHGITILLDLDMHGICASTGSACNSDSLDPSHVLLSIGLPEEIGHGSMRFTFGPQNTMEEAKYLCDVLEEVIPRRRAMSCMWLQGQNKARQFSLKGEQ
mgnify:CR=1 FL=1